jgi:hypothetical protein
MPDWLSSGLCRLVTGGAIPTRWLFTNHDEVVLSAHRPIIPTAIDDIVQRPDVIDRSIFLQLRSIAPSSRRCEQGLWADFMPDYPRILGRLLELAKYHGHWKGTLSQFLELIAEWTGYCAITTPGWPRTPARASIELCRIAPQLRNFSISVAFERSSKGEGLVNFVPSRRRAGPSARWVVGAGLKADLVE